MDTDVGSETTASCVDGSRVRRKVTLGGVVHKITTRMMRQPHRGSSSILHRERTRRRGRRFCPIGSPVVILGGGFLGHFLDLIRTECGMPYHFPILRQPLEMDQTIAAI